MSLKNKLNRLKPHMSIGEESKVDSGIVVTPAPSMIKIPFLKQWEAENVFPYFLDEDYCLVREVKYPLSYQHGHYQFQDFLTAIEIWNKHPLQHPISGYGHKPEELFFFDIETTGLGGGVGNTIFILGHASISGDELILRQHLLPHPGAEVPLYQSFLEKVNYKTLVTYNGKSFDWPQVKTRHTLVREHVPKLPAFGHFDLFHASRRLWKHKLERLKLAVVEKEVLGVERHDDVPGFLAPIIYFDFIESKQPDGMLGILKHNEIDILSLVTLYTHLTFQLHGVDLNRTRHESFEVGRWFASLGEKEEAKKVLTNLIVGTDSTSYVAKRALAFQFKKEKDWEKAGALFEEVVNSENELLVLEASLELSKIYEHHVKDLNRALHFCQKALLISSRLNSVPKAMSKDELQNRLNRVKRKSAL
jgi:uncharacterized protein YprB with RNaseH-like and TPR domain